METDDDRKAGAFYVDLLPGDFATGKAFGRRTGSVDIGRGKKSPEGTIRVHCRGATKLSRKQFTVHRDSGSPSIRITHHGRSATHVSWGASSIVLDAPGSDGDGECEAGGGSGSESTPCVDEAGRPFCDVDADASVEACGVVFRVCLSNPSAGVGLSLEDAGLLLSPRLVRPRSGSAAAGPTLDDMLEAHTEIDTFGLPPVGGGDAVAEPEVVMEAPPTGARAKGAANRHEAPVLEPHDDVAASTEDVLTPTPVPAPKRGRAPPAPVHAESPLGPTLSAPAILSPVTAAERAAAAARRAAFATIPRLGVPDAHSKLVARARGSSSAASPSGADDMLAGVLGPSLALGPSLSLGASPAAAAAAAAAAVAAGRRRHRGAGGVVPDPGWQDVAGDASTQRKKQVAQDVAGAFLAYRDRSFPTPAGLDAFRMAYRLEVGVLAKHDRKASR